MWAPIFPLQRCPRVSWAPRVIMRLRCVLLALALLGTLGGCHRASTRQLTGAGPTRLSDEERMAITMALHYVARTAPGTVRPCVPSRGSAGHRPTAGGRGPGCRLWGRVALAGGARFDRGRPA